MSLNQEWVPVGGWNKSFSEKDKIECRNLFVFFNKDFKEDIAGILANMVLFKQKYHITYSDEQESILANALKRHFIR